MYYDASFSYAGNDGVMFWNGLYGLRSSATTQTPNSPRSKTKRASIISHHKCAAHEKFGYDLEDVEKVLFSDGVLRARCRGSDRGSYVPQDDEVVYWYDCLRAEKDYKHH